MGYWNIYIHTIHFNNVLNRGKYIVLSLTLLIIIILLQLNKIKWSKQKKNNNKGTISKMYRREVTNRWLKQVEISPNMRKANYENNFYGFEKTFIFFGLTDLNAIKLRVGDLIQNKTK